jgi:uncharacterized protein YfaS (alpha-2-macroglobulin family)
MKRIRIPRLVAFLFACVALPTVCLGQDALGPARAAAMKLMQDGNFKEALDAYKALTSQTRTDAPTLVAEDLRRGVECVQRLNQYKEFDGLVENAVKANEDNWHLLETAAQLYQSTAHYGFIVGGEFERGQHRGGGQYANVVERDRIRALQLMRDAEALVREEDDRDAVGEFYRRYAQLYARGGGDSWRMQTLTDLDELPEAEVGYNNYGGGRNGAPVDAEGNPVFYHVPESLEKAASDGERWRWLLAQAAKASPDVAAKARLDFVSLIYQQFGVHTMRGYGWFFRSRDDEDGPRTYDLHTLTVDETICQLASGIRRLHLPDEFSYIRIYEELADAGNRSVSRTATSTLASIFENRRQYDMAVVWWERYKQFDGRHAEERIRQIVGNWGQFENAQSQPAGQPATVDFRYRNGAAVEFTAHRIDMTRVIADTIAYVKGKPARLDWSRVRLDQIGQRIVHGDETKYLEGQVAQWTLDLQPLANHFDRRITVTTPLRTGGVYLLVAKMKDGNVTRIIVQLDDLVVARKQLDGKILYYVADAVTGAPVQTTLHFFGYRTERIDRTNKYNIITKEFADRTDANGQFILTQNDELRNYQWLVTARAGNRLAWHDLSGLGFGRRYDRDYNEVKTFFITDRPVYRPEHTVKWKAWVRHAQYDMEDTSQFAGQTFWVEIRDAKNEKAYGERQVADEYGGIKGELALKEDAALGVYQIIVRREREGGPHVGSGSFRVEEYKKPEFEVTVEAPTEPIMLGEKIEAKVTAKYYFGAPVTEATVKVKVTRSAHDGRWYPVMPWDWFYGSGYWWFAYDYDWYPGWSRWGCSRPIFWWWHRPSPPPELVFEIEVEIGEDGTVAVPIDTELAKLMHGDLDHRYDITAEVRDQSRRTIVGTGQVLVARDPFKVYAWTDRGYYRVGDTIRASFQARRLDGKPVAGAGKLTLYKVSYDTKRQPREAEVQSWDLPCGDLGTAEQQLKASRPGQYRLSYTVTDAKGHDIEGAYVFVVRGEGFDGGDYRFNHIELVPNKKEYRPGEGIELMVNTDRTDSTVLLFVRPTNGVYLPPQVLRLQGKSTVVTLQVTKKDMPNFFVEAMTVADGRIHTDVREIVVPPEKRVLTVDVEPNKERYKPGEEGSARIRLTDELGKPFVGSVVVTVYDKSVEHISGGSNVGDIKSFFWKWRRRHNESTFSNLNRWFTQLLKSGEPNMGNLGVFGYLVADDAMSLDAEGVAWGGAMGSGMGMEGGMGMMDGGSMVRARKAMPAAAPMASGAIAMESSEPFSVSDASGSIATAGLRFDNEVSGFGGSGTPEVTVRTNFADTAVWIASRKTAADGTTTIDLPMPESLTTWKIRVWAMGHGTKVGEGSAEVITSKDLIVRLQAPRFFVETDEVVLSANVHSYVDRERSVAAILELEGPCLKALDTAKRTIKVKANGEMRVDWRVKAMAEGEAVVRMKAIAADDADAMEMRFPVFVHGMDKMDSYCGVIRPDKQTGGTAFNIPNERRPETARLEVRYSPTLAMAMVDALPYLVAYPYGCTEQTLNRFLPAVLTQNTLQRLGVSLELIRAKQANLNAQEIGDPAERAKQWKRYRENPVWDEAELGKIVRDGVEALTAMQLSDGGWGWFSGYGEHSYAHTTAQVVHGLTVATQNDVAVKKEAIERGVLWLKRYQADQVEKLKNAEADPKIRPWKQYADNLDAMVYMVLAEHDYLYPEMRDYLYRDRNQLSLYGKALFGIALHQQKQVEMRDMIIRNIRQYLKTDDESQTAYLEMGNGGYWWWWYGDEIETHALFLRLLAATEPKGDTAHRLVKYLLNNRKHATYWKSTRDTAACVEAFADYMKASGEDKPEQTIQVVLDGKVVKEVKVDSDNLFTFDNTFVLDGAALTGGDHRLELRKQGTGPLYWNAYASYFTLQEFIPKTGLEVKVERRVYRLKSVDKEIDVAGSRNQAIKQKVEKYERIPVVNGDTVTSGDLIEIELLVESKNDYEYILLEDFKAAGFEPVDVRSGYTGNALGAYVEFRDEKVAFFVQRLMRGKHSVSYRLRAEIPGAFSALPTTISAMYAPELRGNSDEIKVKIKDQ